MKNFEDFWPFYLNEHKSALNRRLHFFGTLCGLNLFCLGILNLLAKVMPTWVPFALAFAIGYFFAWLGHFLVEHNRPATFKYPLWSFRADFKMFIAIIKGEIKI